MAERIFFHESVYGPGTIISFEQPVRSQWTIVAKASEKISQVTQADTQDGLGPSYAAARFLCRSQDNQQAFMRIYMQIPYQGTEFASHQVRAQQATRYSHEELAALQTFTKNTSKITPSLLAYKETRQSDQGIIPGGYITYIVWSKVPGIRLANDRRLPRFGAPLHRFWQFSPAEREEIRACFKKEYRNLRQLGFVPSFPWASNLVWDPDYRRIYFVGFGMCHKMDPNGTWDENMTLAGWGLAIRPENRRDHGDLSKWKF